MQPVTLRTARFELSTPTVDDIGTITRICQDVDIQRWTTVPSPYLRVHAEEFVSGMVANGWETGSMRTWCIRDASGIAVSVKSPTDVESASAPLLGMISLTSLDESAAELGYWMAQEARGRGIMGEAVRRVVDYGFSADGMKLGRIEWHAYVENFASAGVARRAGFTYEGVLRMEGLQRGLRHDSWVAGLLLDDNRDEKPGWPLETTALP